MEVRGSLALQAFRISFRDLPMSARLAEGEGCAGWLGGQGDEVGGSVEQNAASVRDAHIEEDLGGVGRGGGGRICRALCCEEDRW